MSKISYLRLRFQQQSIASENPSVSNFNPTESKFYSAEDKFKFITFNHFVKLYFFNTGKFISVKFRHFLRIENAAVLYGGKRGHSVKSNNVVTLSLPK